MILNSPLVEPITWILLVAAVVGAHPAEANMAKALDAFIRLRQNTL